MSAETNLPPKNPAALEAELQRFQAAGFRQTDAQFSVAYAGGFDLIDENHRKRVYVAPVGSIESEAVLMGVLGTQSVIPLKKITTDFAIYDLPPGARSLRKTMKTGPYAKPYMQSLALRSLQFLEKIYKLDPNAFGLTLGSIAISHDGDAGYQDDIFLTVIPPLQPTSNPEVERLGIHKFINDSRVRQRGVVAFDAPIVEQYRELVAGMHEVRPALDTGVLDKYFDTEQGGKNVSG